MQQLADAHVPFAVQDHYSIRADMHKFGTQHYGATQTKHTQLDTDYPEYIHEKLELLLGAPAECRVLACGADVAGLTAALWAFAEVVAAEQPAFVCLDARGLVLRLLGITLNDRFELGACEAVFGELGARVRAYLEQQQGVLRLIDALAFAMQEDYVIMHQPDGQTPAYAELLQVCFPSYWSPKGRAGETFAEIHRPVANSDALVAASANVMKAMLNKGPFVRFVWSLSADNRLTQNPALHTPAPKTRVPCDALFFRVERQTTLALPSFKRAVFTIRIYRAPLALMLQAGTTRAALLARAVRSMNAELLRYKGLHDIKDDLLTYLDNYG